MIVLAREVFLCKCSTDVPSGRGGDDDAPPVRFVAGSARHLELLDPALHDAARLDEFRVRLARGEYWLVGLLGEDIATYTWLHTRPRCEYSYLPGCAFALPDDYGYGYDAWTPPALRGGGLRRAAFVEELRVLSSLGKAWEASFFVHYQLEGARRSLARACVTVVPLWRVALDRGGPGRRHLVGERLVADGGGAEPEFAVTTPLAG
jgi:hypothetical protein